MKPKPIYWSQLHTYADGCPLQALWNYGFADIDLGDGLGRSKPKPLPRKSEHHAVLGKVIGKVFENFYNNEWWKAPASVHRLLLEDLDVQFLAQLGKATVDYKQMAQSEMFDICKNGILGYLHTFKAHRLVGGYAKSEVVFRGHLDKNTEIGGRVDLVFSREDTGVTIMDGKNSKRYKDGFWIDEDQLRLYALCYQLQFAKPVDRLGFIFFRYPYGQDVLGDDGKPTGEKETGVQWVDFDQPTLKILADKARDTISSMRKHQFDAKPSNDNCKLCDYEACCPARQAQKLKSAEDKSAEISEKYPGGGIIELDFGG
jgi:hypothetical protein